MNKSPAFQFYPKDFLGSGAVAGMSLDEVGAYILLLSYDWNEDGLPNDMPKLARFVRVSPKKFERIWKILRDNFSLVENKWRNKRLDLERERQAVNRAKKADAAHKRWGNVHSTSNADAMQVVCPSSSTATASSTALLTTTTSSGAEAPAPKARRKPSPAKYPAFPEEDCGSLWQAWNQTFGGVEYPAFRKALGSFYQASETPPRVEQVAEAIKAYREAVDEMDEREAGFQSIHKFAQRLDHWLKVGAMDYSTPLGLLTERGRVLGSKAIREQQRGTRTA